LIWPENRPFRARQEWKLHTKSGEKHNRMSWTRINPELEGGSNHRKKKVKTKTAAAPQEMGRKPRLILSRPERKGQFSNTTTRV